MESFDHLAHFMKAFQLNPVETGALSDLLEGKEWDERSSTPRLLELTMLKPDGGRCVKPRLLQFLSAPDMAPDKSYLQLYYPALGTDHLVFEQHDLSAAARLMQYAMRPGNGYSHLVCLHGPSGSGRRSLLRCVAHAGTLNLLSVDTPQIAVRFEELLPELKMESLLIGAVLCFENFTGDTTILRSLVRELYPATGLVLFTCEQPLPFLDRDDVVIMNTPMPQSTQSGSQRLWTALASKLPCADTVDCKALSETFSFTPYQIKQILQAALTEAISSGETQIQQRHILTACMTFRSAALADLGDIVKPVFTWEDLILPETAKNMLRAAVDRIKHNNTVYHEWGFAGKMPYGTGLHILLTGSPGTGKTMAASILSGELNLPLLRVDLSAIMSKFIGETEKNLGRIFEAAAQTDCIIFFDEADSLFGKRSETKDSHDRYANLQVSYLLQKIEQHKGVTILATNLLKNFDEAFQRRFHFIVSFPLPETKEKKLLWQKSFPSNAPVGEELDFDYLAENFSLTGGNIKNIVLAAAFYAAAHGDSIRMIYVMQAVKEEYEKIGMPLSKKDFLYT